MRDWEGEAERLKPPCGSAQGVKEGDYFGELALLDKGEHTASVCAITPVEVLLLSKYDFYHHVDTKTQAMMKTFAEKFYFDEGSIRKHISKQHRWDAYKKNLLKDVVSRKS